MLLSRRRLLVASVAVPLLAACRSYPSAPDVADRPIALTVVTRDPRAADRLPALQVTGAAGAVRFHVARPAFCATLADGRAGVRGQEVTIVATVAGNPAALCIGGALVVEYSGEVAGLARGRYTVHVWEAVADGPPRSLGTATVEVGPPGA